MIYRIPPSRTNGIKGTDFFAEFACLLEKLILCQGNLIIIGDINIKWDCINSTETKKYCSILDNFGLKQNVNEPTHMEGHTLDHVNTRSDDSFLCSITISDCISDHFSVHSRFSFKKPPIIRKQITYRKVKDVNLQCLSADIESSNINSTAFYNGDADTCVETYNTVLQSLLNKHAPEKSMSVTVRHKVPWFNEEVKRAIAIRRKTEKKWRLSVNEHRDLLRNQFKEARNNAIRITDKAKSQHYNQRIIECGSDQKRLFKIANELLHRKTNSHLPNYINAKDLATNFNEYFIHKIETIREGLSVSTDEHITPEPQCDQTLHSLRPTDEEEIAAIISKSSNASCELDPMPTWMLKACVEPLIPAITHITNASILSGKFPSKLKHAIVKPLLKKESLDPNIMKNYRPVSNIPYLSKIIEKVVLTRIDEHMTSNNLHENLQSAYRRNSSTETAQLKIHNDILRTLDTRKGIIMVMLDMSAAFDTIEHSTLLDRLRSRIGLRDAALQWFASYHDQRTQAVKIENSTSEPVILRFGAPQGSLMGAEEYKIYTLQVGNILRHHDLEYHIYADDSGIYMSFCISDREDLNQVLNRIKRCLLELKAWMSRNKLKLNDDKTEVLLITPAHRGSRVDVTEVPLFESPIPVSETAKSLGVVLDSHMTMSRHIDSVCKSAFMHLRNIAGIREYLSQDACERLIHAFVTSRIDYNNSLFYGLPVCQIKRLQRIQNCAARVVKRLRKHDHVSWALRELHWLPVHHRVQFKMLTLVHRCLNDMAPGYLSDTLQRYKPARALRSEKTKTLVLPRTRTRYGNRAFSCAGPELWNALPEDLRSIQSLPLFKSRLKTHFFNLAYK